jgi:hypothetical protein
MPISAQEGVTLVQTVINALTNQTFWVALEAIAVVVTVGYGIKQYLEMRSAREERDRPYVIVDFEVTGWLIDVAVSNIGAGAAKDVTFAFNPELVASDDRNLSESFWLFKEGAGFLPPGKKISTLFDASNQYFASGKPLLFDLHISYKDIRSKAWATSMKLDLSMYKGRLFVQRKGVHEIAETMEKLEQRVQSALAPLGRGILVLTQEDVDKHWEVVRQRREQEREGSDGEP